MDESDSSQPAKCPCGFWGSSKTHGLCSRCYQEKSEVSLDSNNTMDDSPQKSHHVAKPDILPAGTSGLKIISTSNASVQNSASKDPANKVLFGCSDSESNAHASMSQQIKNIPMYQLPNNVIPNIALDAEHQSMPTLMNVVNLDTNNSGEHGSKKPSHKTAKNSTQNDSKSEDEDSDSSRQRKGVKRPRSCDDAKASSDSSKSPSPQKNKKRCYKCSCKLNIAQRAIGRCKCGCIFCQVHRMPEQHNCDFDHKEDGRREAKEKMVKPRRHVGTTCKRIDSENT